MLTEQIDIVVEVGQQHQIREVLEGVFGIAGQPVFNDFLLRFHISFWLLRCKDRDLF
jgi:hypothetical protein